MTASSVGTDNSCTQLALECRGKCVNDAMQIVTNEALHEPAHGRQWVGTFKEGDRVALEAGGEGPHHEV